MARPLVRVKDSIQDALDQLAPSGGQLIIPGGSYHEHVVVDKPDVTFTRRGGRVILIGSLHLSFEASRFNLGLGFTIQAADPYAQGIYGIHNEADIGVVLDNPWFRSFGNKITDDLPWSIAPAAYRQTGTTNNGVTRFADFHHIRNPHFEFCYSGLQIGEGANAMVSGLVGRQFHKNGIWSYTGGPGADEGALQVFGYWLANPDQGQILVYLQRESDARLNGHNGLYGGVTEAGRDNPAIHYRVESHTNEIHPKSLLGGSVGFEWIGEDNEWKEPTRRSTQGSSGPPVDHGMVGYQRQL